MSLPTIFLQLLDMLLEFFFVFLLKHVAQIWKWKVYLSLHIVHRQFLSSTISLIQYWKIMRRNHVQVNKKVKNVWTLYQDWVIEKNLCLCVELQLFVLFKDTHLMQNIIYILLTEGIHRKNSLVLYGASIAWWEINILLKLVEVIWGWHTRSLNVHGPELTKTTMGYI